MKKFLAALLVFGLWVSAGAVVASAAQPSGGSGSGPVEYYPGGNG